MRLSKASTLADRLITEISPFCVRCEVAGSIRRRKDEVKDIEIVAIPKIDIEQDLTSLFPQTIEVNRLHEWSLSAALLWIKPGVSEIIPWTVKPDGKYWRGLLPGDIKLDLFLATPENWGIIFAIRTGSAEFTTALVTQARDIGIPCIEGSLTRHGKPVPTPEEEDVFRLLGLKYVEPPHRTGFRDIVKLTTVEL